MKRIADLPKMNKSGWIISLILLLSINLMAQPAEKDDDKTLSPYFFVKSNSLETEQLPLKSTKVVANIAGIIADVKVTQEYKNEGRTPIEAIYVFPASTRAAVYGMTMTIGSRVVKAEISEREKARKDYEQAKRQGKSASLLEQQRPNVFQMNIANIMPGDVIKVELLYTEMLVPENGIYEFVYPTVVGPRYSNQPASTAPETDKWVANPYTSQGVKPMSSFDIKVNVNAGMTIGDVRSISHDININYLANDKLTAVLKPGNEFEGNRDFIFQYRLRGDAIQSGILLYKGRTENFFLAMMQPPQRVTVDNIPPREYVFIVDVSGSMHGFPLETSKKLMSDLIGKLRPSDCFNVLLFSGAASTMSPNSIPASQDNIQKAITFINNQQGGGGTELLTALQKALALPRAENTARSFVILTDGYVNVEKASFELVRNNLGNANFFAFGIGSSVNRFLIEGLAHAGMGESFIVDKPDNAAEKAEQFRKYIESPVLTNISVTYPGFEAYDVEPLTVPDLFAQRPVIVFGKWRGIPKGKISLKGQCGNHSYTNEIAISAVNISTQNKALRYLWARKRIQKLDDYAGADHGANNYKVEVTSLGLKYNLLTAYTSFVAIDSEIRNTTGTSQFVKQPLPLPKGVSNLAVGRKASVTNYTQSQIISEDANAVDVAELKVSEVVQEKEEIFQCIEQMPDYPGGTDALSKFLSDNLKYPKIAAEMGISGRVYVKFVINKRGEIVDLT
ncbi:MAG: VIT domain-containing protein [Bacteroidota bacterium]|nr:VIT domain-containing protein [Bacteroidota bacterium]